LIAKTRADCLSALVDAVKSQHSYECPCIVALAVAGGNNAFLDWVNTQVGPQFVEDEKRHER
jgi:periplasmic divalent cation tolerance protein